MNLNYLNFCGIKFTDFPIFAKIHEINCWRQFVSMWTFYGSVWLGMNFNGSTWVNVGWCDLFMVGCGLMWPFYGSVWVGVGGCDLVMGWCGWVWPFYGSVWVDVGGCDLFMGRCGLVWVGMTFLWVGVGWCGWV